MDKEMAKGIVNLLAGFQPRTIVLIGGEPTVWNHYFTLARHIAGKGLRTTVVSNGLTFANYKFVEKSVRAGITNVTISVKGFSPQGYEAGCGYSGGYEVVKRAIANLSRTPIKTMISITVSYDIVERWKEITAFLKEFPKGFYSFSFEKPVILADGTVAMDDRMMPGKIASWIQDVMYPSLAQSGIDFKAEFVFPHCQFPQSFIDEVEKSNHVFGGCLLLKSNGVVFDPAGNVLPCNHFVGFPLGKYGVDFKTSEEFLMWRESQGDFYKKTMSAPCEECGKCNRWYKCGAGCRLWWLYRGTPELIKTETASV